MSDFKHIVRFVFPHGLPAYMRDSVNAQTGNTHNCPPTEWCIEHVGLMNYSWKRLVHTPYYGKGMIFYYFKEEHHALLFKLTWQDYAASGPSEAIA